MGFMIIGRLTDAQALDYDLALVGQPGAATDQGSVPPQPGVDPDAVGEAFEPQGCWGDAYGDLLTMLTFLDEFQDELVSLNSRFAADPRVATLDNRWSTCMQANEYQYPDRTAMIDDVYARLLDLEVVETDTGTNFAAPELVDDLAEFER